MNSLQEGKSQPAFNQINSQKSKLKQEEIPSFTLNAKNWDDINSTPQFGSANGFDTATEVYTMHSIRKWVQGIQLANQLSQVLQGIQPFDETLQSVIDGLCLTSNADQCTLFLNKNGYLQPSYTSPILSVSSITTDTALREFYQLLYSSNQSQPQMLVLNLAHQHQYSEQCAQWMQSQNIHSAILISLVCQEKFLGVISLTSKQSQQWNHDELSLIELIANQCAVAI